MKVDHTKCWGSALIESVEICTKAGSRLALGFFDRIGADDNLHIEARGYIAVGDKLAEVAKSQAVPLPIIIDAFAPELKIRAMQVDITASLVDRLLKLEDKNG